MKLQSFFSFFILILLQISLLSGCSDKETNVESNTRTSESVIQSIEPSPKDETTSTQKSKAGETPVVVAKAQSPDTATTIPANAPAEMDRIIEDTSETASVETIEEPVEQYDPSQLPDSSLLPRRPETYRLRLESYRESLEIQRSLAEKNRIAGITDIDQYIQSIRDYRSGIHQYRKGISSYRNAFSLKN